MMPDLGKYTGAVTGAYAVSLLLIVGLVAVSIWRSTVVRRALKEVEDRAGKDRG